MSKQQNQSTDTGERARATDPKEELLRTRHKVVIGDGEVAYTAVAGTIVLKEEDGTSKASVFYVAYTQDGIGDPAKRPITFSFNGGPGSSSVWLHLGLLGPKRVLMDDEGYALPPPYQLVDNAYSLLDETDLVFIDPVSTGYSRGVSEDTTKQYHAFDKDIESVGEFIRLFTTRFGRWSSPKFLIGESYGTTRAAGLAGYLQDKSGMYLNGIMLISSILNFQTARFDVGNDMPYILFLPTYAATAWFHGCLDPDLQADLRRTLAEVESFAQGEYTLALMQGASLPAKDRHEIAQKLARYTGLSQAYVEHTDLRIEIFRFVKELLRNEERTVGRLDSRITGIDRDAAGEQFDYDPSLAAITGPYTATLNDYVRRDLKFESDLPYEILTSRVQPWDYSKHQNQYVNVAETLRGAMTRNPHLKIFVANGFYDLATPYLATRYTFDHLGVDQSLQSNISMEYYEAGHMMYIHMPSLIRLKADLSAFVRSSVPDGDG